MLKVNIILFLSFAALSCAAPQGRVVNGTDSEINSYPFVVSLRSVQGRLSCGGSIIAPNWILTAAHCVNRRDIFNMTIQYGVTKVNSGGPNIAKVKRFIYHENYDSEDIVNDVALLELSGRLIYNYKTIAPVKLPPSGYQTPQTRSGGVGNLVGWGRNYTGSNTMETLQEVTLKLYSDEECAERHGDNVSPNNICAGVDDGWKGQCSGDSGGPLIEKSSGYQVGIVSWSQKPCTIPPYPGVYTKIAPFIDWINANMKS